MCSASCSRGTNSAYLHLSGGASPMNPIQLPGRLLGPFDHGRARPAFLSRFTTSSWGGICSDPDMPFFAALSRFQR